MHAGVSVSIAYLKNTFFCIRVFFALLSFLYFAFSPTNKKGSGFAAAVMFSMHDPGISDIMQSYLLPPPQRHRLRRHRESAGYPRAGSVSAVSGSQGQAMPVQAPLCVCVCVCVRDREGRGQEMGGRETLANSAF